MITLYGFGRVHSGMSCKVRDLRAQWALEEPGLPYRVHALEQRSVRNRTDQLHVHG